MSVAAETLVSGAHVYRVTVKLRESGGAAATVASIDLTFMSGSSAVTSLHVERPISDAANLLAANATLDSRELMAMDEDPSHPHATSVVTKVNYTYGASLTRSADGLAPGAVVECADFHVVGHRQRREHCRPAHRECDRPGRRRAERGKELIADGNGADTLTNLAAGSFSIRASASGYNVTERAVTVAQDTRLDLKLLRTPVSPGPTPPPPSPGACAYTVSPSQSGTDHNGGNLAATISRTAGNCSWQATSSASWITFPGGASGNGSATLAYAVAPNPTFNTRTGSVTISWAGGSAQIQVQQGHYPDWVCYMSVAKGPQDFNNVPPAGGQLTVTVTLWAVPAGWSPQCQGSALSSVPWITGGGSSNGGEPAGAHTFTFSVAAGTARNGSIVVTGAGRAETLAVRQQ